MEWLFGRKKTPKEMLREAQRALKKSMRELDRERVALERQEKKVIADIKASAKAGQNAVMRIQAKDLVRTRNHVKKLILMHSQIQAVSLTIQTMNTTNTMATAMRDVTKAMGRMNRTMNLPAMQQIMANFEKEQEIMGMKQEAMDDTIDEVMGEEEDEEQTEEIVNQVFDELGLSLDGEMAKPPTAQYEVPASDADAELQARLNNLRGS